MAGELITPLEQRLEEIDKQIELLQRDRAVLRRMIYREMTLAYVREEGIKVTAKNQQELYFWYVIRQLLSNSQKSSGRGLRSREIRDRLLGQQEKIKYTTLRSYLHRFSKDGRIRKDERSYTWVLSDHRKEAE